MQETAPSVPVAARPEETLCAATVNPTQVLHFASGLVVWIVIGTFFGVTLELPDQKTRDFLVRIALPRCFLERAHQLFGEILVMI
jgi:hypothetical protein